MVTRFIHKIMSFVLHLFDVDEPYCNICSDSKQIEVLIMGTDTQWIECPYCS